VLFVGALVAAAAISGGGRVDVSQSLAPWLWSALAALPGTGGGAALGVSVARVIGWRRQTVAGTVFGVFGGALLAWAVYRLR
jgi:hypothetical protein